MLLNPHWRFTADRCVTDEAAVAMARLSALEPLFISGGRLAHALQHEVDAELKAATGDFRIDVVTRADRAVQEVIVAGLVEAGLDFCTLVAEETPLPGQVDLRGRFAPRGALSITLDPIDGTSRYVAGHEWFSTIVGLHDGRQPLYTFMFYPALDWWVRIHDREITMSGPPPVDLTHLGLERTVVFTAGSPARDAPEAFEALCAQGVAFRSGESVHPCGSKYLYLSGHAGGYFAGSPNPYDGLFALHCALARGSTVLARGASSEVSLDLARCEIGPRGAFHPGWYLAAPSRLAE